MDICGCTKRVGYIEVWGTIYSVDRDFKARGMRELDTEIFEDIKLLANRGGEPAKITYEDGSTKGSESKITDDVDALTAWIEFLVTAQCKGLKYQL